MITDHGVRTLYTNVLQSGYKNEAACKFNSALSDYRQALGIAKSFDDMAGIENCNKCITRVTKKISNERTL